MVVWKQTSTVGEGGRVEVIVPNVPAGQSVSVIIESDADTIPGTSPKKRAMGLLKGKIWISDDFDAPLDDFAEYM